MGVGEKTTVVISGTLVIILVVSSTDGVMDVDRKGVVLMVKKLEDTIVVVGLGVMGTEEVVMSGGFSRKSSISAFIGPAME